MHLEKLCTSQGAVCACEARSWAESCGVLRGVFCGAAVGSHSGACCLGKCVVRAELCSECGWEFACARVCGPASRCVCPGGRRWGGHRWALRASAPPSPHLPLPLSAHSRNGAFRTLLVPSSSSRHGCGAGVGGDSWGQPLPPLLQLTLHLPFLSLPQAGPHPLRL